MATMVMNPKCGTLEHYGKRGWRKNANFYTNEEDLVIIKEVLVRIKDFTLGGRALWISIEETGILPGRTWQSLKERFRKSIYPRLHTFEISDSDKKRLLKTCERVDLNDIRKRDCKMKTLGNNASRGKYFERLKSLKLDTKNLPSASLIEIEDDSDWGENEQVDATCNGKPKKRKLYYEETLLGPVSPLLVPSMQRTFQLPECKVHLQRLKTVKVAEDFVVVKSVLSDVNDCYCLAKGAGNEVAVSKDLGSHEKVSGRNTNTFSNQSVTNLILQEKTLTDYATKETEINESSMSEIVAYPRVRKQINTDVPSEDENSNTIQLVENINVAEEGRVDTHLMVEKELDACTDNIHSTKQDSVVVNAVAKEIVHKENYTISSDISTVLSSVSSCLVEPKSVENLVSNSATNSQILCTSTEECGGTPGSHKGPKPLKSLLDQDLSESKDGKSESHNITGNTTKDSQTPDLCKFVGLCQFTSTPCFSHEENETGKDDSSYYPETSITGTSLEHDISVLTNNSDNIFREASQPVVEHSSCGSNFEVLSFSEDSEIQTRSDMSIRDSLDNINGHEEGCCLQ